MDYDFFRGVSWVLLFFWPSWANFFGLTAFPKNSIDILTRVYQTALVQRGGYETEVKETRDLLDALIKIKQDCARDNEDMPDEKLLAHAAVFVQGGFDTTASILSWCIYELAFRTEIQDNMYMELVDLQKDKEELKDIDLGSLSNLSYLNAVIDGRRFALINLRCAVAYMVVTYKFRPLAATPSPSRVQVERHSLFYAPGEPLLIDFEPRK
ncbi:PREDICTED: probable cytochrome P450 6w1 [Papilio xuthus]|uniref:unspecific monooxygenase n=1 Tax=Papilio xuthus TaxID=66420 RepID=A0AAJ7EE97_PAPXU|nr:PREDICTED: probable cytochrome P450 6w1 [Papilio xuthus]